MWRRRLVIPFLALVALNVVALLAFTLPRGLKQRNLVTRLGSLRSEVEAQRKETAALRERAHRMKANEADRQRFFNEVVTTREAGLVPLLTEVEKVAADPGLKSGTRSYSPDEVKELPGIVRVQANVAIKGGYRELVGFLSKFERSKRFVSVDRVQLTQVGAEGRSEGNLTVELSAYFREDRETSDAR